jgi:hypothetical protein
VSKSSYDNYTQAGNLAGGCLIILLIVFAIGVFVAVKLLQMVVKAFVRQPKNKVLWGCLGSVVFFAVLSAVTGSGVVQAYSVAYVAGVVAHLSLIALLITAYTINIIYDHTFQRQKRAIVQEVLHTPWWL